jgi:hypothetical protein
MRLPVMAAAERDDELVAHRAAERAGLEAPVRGAGGCPLKDPRFGASLSEHHQHTVGL